MRQHASERFSVVLWCSDVARKYMCKMCIMPCAADSIPAAHRVLPTISCTAKMLKLIFHIIHIANGMMTSAGYLSRSWSGNPRHLAVVQAECWSRCLAVQQTAYSGSRSSMRSLTLQTIHSCWQGVLCTTARPALPLQHSCQCCWSQLVKAC